MNAKKPSLFIITLLFFSIISCKEEEDPLPDPCINSDLVVNLDDGSWKATSIDASIKGIESEGLAGLELEITGTSNNGSSINITLRNFEGTTSCIMAKEYFIDSTDNDCVEVPSGQTVCDGVTMTYDINNVDSYISYDAPGKVTITNCDESGQLIEGTYDFWLSNFADSIQLQGSFNSICW